MIRKIARLPAVAIMLSLVSPAIPVCAVEAPRYARAKTLQGHQEEVVSVAFSPDGSLLASGSNDGQVILWETAGWQRVHAMKGHKGDLRGVLFTPDGRLLASGDEDGKVIFWDTATGKEQSRIVTKYDVRGMAFSPDGKMMATGTDDPKVLLWNLPTGKRLKVIDEHRGQTRAVAFAADGKVLISGGEDANVVLYNLARDEHEHLRQQPDKVLSLAYSPDGKWLAAGGSKGVIAVWEMPGGTNPVLLRGPKEAVTGVVFLDGGAILASVDDSGEGECGVRFWDVQKKALLGMAKSDCDIKALAASRDGRYLAIAGKNIVIMVRQGSEAPHGTAGQRH